MKRKILCLFAILLIYPGSKLFSKIQADTIKALIVIAHPDDETAFAATVYKITKEMHGIVDLVVITNGEGGYKYSTLAEAYYGLPLTDEKTGRENLPRIRKQEMKNAAHIIGVRNIFFLDQKDAHYTTDEKEPLDTSWNCAFIQNRLTAIMSKVKYDFVFCILPTPATHGGHKAATILALRTVAQLPANVFKPAVLGVRVKNKTDTAQLHFSGLDNYTETTTLCDTPSFSFDRTVPFGYKNQLNYKIIVNWEIAEHKSQGTMQMGMNGGDYEQFWFFKQNDISSYEKCRLLFERLEIIPYPYKTY